MMGPAVAWSQCADPWDLEGNPVPPAFSFMLYGILHPPFYSPSQRGYKALLTQSNDRLPRVPSSSRNLQGTTGVCRQADKQPEPEAVGCPVHRQTQTARSRRLCMVSKERVGRFAGLELVSSPLP